MYESACTPDSSHPSPVSGSQGVAGLSVKTLMAPSTGKSFVSPFALMPWMFEPVGMSMMTDGKLGSASSAPVEMVRVATPGDPVMYAEAALFPEAATTTTPAWAALSLAVADGSVGLPHDDPSDMLMTSAPSRTARSMASRTRSLPPSHPKTR